MYPGAHAQAHPDRIAVRVGDGPGQTYKELDEQSIRLARALQARGLREGDAIALLAENHIRFFEVYWAAVRSGLYITAVNRHSTPDEIAYILKDSGASAFITSYAMRDTVAATLPLLDEVQHRLMFDGVIDGIESYEDALAGHPATPLSSEPRGQLMLYSSGTTGRPKGVRRELSGLQVDDPSANRSSVLVRGITTIDGDSAYLIPAPLYHAAGLNWAVAVQEIGGTVLVMQRWDPEEFLATVERHRVTHTQLVPTMMVRLLKLPAQVRERYDLTSLRAVIHSAAPCPVEVKTAMLDWLGPIVDEYYSGTEGHGVTFVGADEWRQRPGSVGRSLYGAIHICDDAGVEVPAGTIGAVYFEQSFASFSYHNDAEKSAEARHPREPTWSTIGDMGHVDEDGYLYLADRKSFMIISGGVNIYPAEIEGRLIMHPGVADVAVFGMPDPDMGEYVHAVVQPARDVEPGKGLEEELVAFAGRTLARYKLPRVIDFQAELPRMESGKLRKNLLREGLTSARR
ncbi:acyl-CoA synthetase (plasmid) [Tomitella fengzijianii]|uniref:Acyl-CoA synthetase n=1 Tax=Tomitella fengzijianii TaxID=2597660 RepID=A0A516X915_9ACTN|nr:acyl-CoA synthetase [Tomitella fengzijianii]QDQ99513.1 acyl-CoA synthetase [Tomitella fengzijianii]